MLFNEREPEQKYSKLDTFLTAVFAQSVNIFYRKNYSLVFKYNIRLFEHSKI